MPTDRPTDHEYNHHVRPQMDHPKGWMDHAMPWYLAQSRGMAGAAACRTVRHALNNTGRCLRPHCLWDCGPPRRVAESIGSCVDQLCPLRPSRINVKCCRKSNGGSTGLPNDVAQMRSRCHVTLPAKKASPRSNASISLHLSNRGLDTIGSCFALPPPPLNPKCLPRTMRP